MYSSIEFNGDLNAQVVIPLCFLLLMQSACLIDGSGNGFNELCKYRERTGRLSVKLVDTVHVGGMCLKYIANQRPWAMCILLILTVKHHKQGLPQICYKLAEDSCRSATS